MTLHAERQRLGSVPVQASGQFAARLRGDVLRNLFAPGVVGIVAEAVVAEPWHPPGWSDVVAIDLPAPASILVWLYAGLVAALIAGLLWRRWRDRRRELALADELAAAVAGLSPVRVRSVAAGGRGDWLTGAILDGERGRPTAGTLLLVGPGEASIAVDAIDGRCEIGPLVPGSWRLTVDVAEHAPFALQFDVPHDGIFDGCELLPRSCRAVVRGALSERVEAASGKGVDWQRETPRLAEKRWLGGRRRGHVRIRAAVTAVEAALYGRTASREVVAAVEHGLLDADREQP